MIALEHLVVEKSEPPPAVSDSHASVEHRQQPPKDTSAPDLTGKITKLDNHYARPGGFSDVYKCRYTSFDGVRMVAVKVFRFYLKMAESTGEASEANKMIRREFGIWRRLCHPNIVPFLGFVRDFWISGSTSLVSKWMSNGSLDGFYTKYDDQLMLPHRLQLLMDMANGLSYLHSFPIVHGDLTCTNVLIDHNFNACLTDFGLASMVGDIPDAMRYLQMSSLRPGAIRWAAPEHCADNPSTVIWRTTKSNIYSFGNLSLFTLSGKHPWSEVPKDVAVIIRLHQGDKPNRPTSRAIEDKHWEFIEHCWSVVDERPESGDVMAFLRVFLDSCQPAKPLRDFLCAPSDATGPSDISSPLHTRPKDAKRVRFEGNQISPTLPRKPSWHDGFPLDPYSPAQSTPELKRRQSLDGRSRPWRYASPWPDLSPRFQVHPLLNGEAFRMDLYFDFASSSFSPHSRTSLGRVSVTSKELQQNATYPLTTRMRITHDAIPQWPINLKYRQDGPSITVCDVLYEIYYSLHKQINHYDWARLGQHDEDAISRAYTRRCRSVPSSADVEASRGVKRIDYLLDKHIFRGLVKTPDEDGFYCWKLISVTDLEFQHSIRA